MNEVRSNLELMHAAVGEQKKCSKFPKVGVVVAKDGKILATGYRGEIEGQHAERVAINKLQPTELDGATIVTTLEPCVEMHSAQPEASCAELITTLPIKEVIIGVLDPNGKIYGQGAKALQQAGISISYFEPHLREQVEAATFKEGDVNTGYGPAGKRRVAVVGSGGKRFKVHLSPKESASVDIRWHLLQFSHGVVDLHAENDSVREAVGARCFEDIADPLIYREPTHAVRMRVGEFATVYPQDAKFILLIKLVEMTQWDIVFQWQVRALARH